jgi:hypothetical protein
VTGELRGFALRLDPSTGSELYPVVTVLVDGVDLVGGHRNLPFYGFRAAEIVGVRSPLLPGPAPRRVAVYRCDCGIARCAVLAPVIWQRGKRLVWSDLLAFSSAFSSPTSHRRLRRSAKLWLPDLEFDLAAYGVEVERVSREALVVTPQLAAARLMARRQWEGERLARQTEKLIRDRCEAAPVPGYRFGRVTVPPDQGLIEVTLRRHGERGFVDIVIRVSAPPAEPAKRADLVAWTVGATHPRDWDIVSWNVVDLPRLAHR